VKIKNLKEDLTPKKEEIIKKETPSFKKEETPKKASVKTFSKNDQKVVFEPASSEAPKKSFFVKKEDVVAKPVESKKFAPK
jgi:hypothetical protein